MPRGSACWCRCRLAGGALVLATDSAVLESGLDATLSTGVAIALVGTPLMLAMIRARCRVVG